MKIKFKILGYTLFTFIVVIVLNFVTNISLTKITFVMSQLNLGAKEKQIIEQIVGQITKAQGTIFLIGLVGSLIVLIVGIINYLGINRSIKEVTDKFKVLKSDNDGLSSKLVVSKRVN
ncbi:hypothetical protein EW093_16805 [Thiospirochaeta perfilievii]|uniref:Uncharacterized protein n=1 Tax=Thiospirochaeta perfilievii TaxID=252967 RepID=A0A5C1QFT3_9SPIO|nr:hypothetical protein [Thiospirochaeta perfilievii]QEN06277.1 hypothetical protein EW093_16805 [Thiospirochaeta perfilievii]